MSTFQFGAHAIHTPESEPRFIERRDSIIESIKPANIVESMLAEELLHASWDMERARENGDNTYSSASRTWHRSLNQLKKLQSARASHLCELAESTERAVAAQCPLADITKLPKPLVIDIQDTQGVQ